jgi:hypothetical protein
MHTTKARSTSFKKFKLTFRIAGRARIGGMKFERTPPEQIAFYE